MMTNMIGPLWLAAALGIVMLAAAAFAGGRMLVAWRLRRVTDYEVDAHHVLMGVSMAGMLIPALGIVSAGASVTIWLLVWIVVTVWFAVSVVRAASVGAAGGRFSGHHLPHLVMSAAMLYMFAVIAEPWSWVGHVVWFVGDERGCAGSVAYPRRPVRHFHGRVCCVGD